MNVGVELSGKCRPINVINVMFTKQLKPNGMKGGHNSRDACWDRGGAMVVHMAKVVRDNRSAFHHVCVRHRTDAEAEVIVLLHFE